MNKRSKEEAKKNGRKVGIASWESLRANKSLAKEIAQQPALEKLKGRIQRTGLNISDDDMTCNAAIMADEKPCSKLFVWLNSL